MALFQTLKHIFAKKGEENLSAYQNEKEEDHDRQKQMRVQLLSKREYEAFCLLIEGYTLRFCAEKMGIKYCTANTYQNAIYKKLGVQSRANLIIQYKDIHREENRYV